MLASLENQNQDDGLGEIDNFDAEPRNEINNNATEKTGSPQWGGANDATYNEGSTEPLSNENSPEKSQPQ